MSRFGLILLGFIALQVGGCRSLTEPDPSLMNEDPTSVGPIVARDVPTSFSEDRPTIHVRADGDECGIIYVVSDSIPIKRKDSQGRFVDVAINELTVGLKVAVWTDIVLTSCPGQAGAHAVEAL